MLNINNDVTVIVTVISYDAGGEIVRLDSLTKHRSSEDIFKLTEKHL